MMVKNPGWLIEIHGGVWGATIAALTGHSFHFFIFRALTHCPRNDVWPQELFSSQDLWSSNLTFYSGYALSDLMSTAAALVKCLLQAPHSKYTAAYDKYNTASKSHVARLPSLHEEMLKSFTTES